ncbi:hypothetical protein DN068_18165 [Taibaiella soli]|uniref:Uncharacterized protein n=1 Tax=Taibaiella soli TaxID=1649169 RepID=A0A2W2ACY2_9BACT|nr:hypothetical protein DN068_18165 [Taibaiella soli]
MSIAQKGVRVVDNKGTVQYVDTSKWFSLGNNLYNKNKTGNIGIGLDTSVIPSARLVVSNGGNSSLPPLKLQYPLSGALADSVLTWNSADSTVRKIPAGTLLNNAWLRNGNAGTNPGTFASPGPDFIGTTDAAGFVIQTNNTERLRVLSAAPTQVGVATDAPAFTTPANTGAAIPTFGVDGTINATNYTNPVQTVTGGAWDMSKGATAKWTLAAGANTLTVTNMKAGMYGSIIVTNTGTSTISFGSGTNKVINGGGGAPTLTPVAGAVDVLSFLYDGTTFWWTVGNNFN